VDLSATLRRQELDEHLAAVARIGRELGLEAGEIESRLRAVLGGRGADEP
jgi:hypothetical protein